jgi:hypothetical protein
MKTIEVLTSGFRKNVEIAGSLVNQTSGFMKDFGTTWKIAKKDKDINEFLRKNNQIAARRAALLVLAAAELFPGLENVNDVTKLGETLTKIREVKKGLNLKDLYPDVPEKVLAVAGAMDVAGIPLAGAIPEVIQEKVDMLYNTPAGNLSMASRLVQIYHQVREERLAASR